MNPALVISVLGALAYIDIAILMSMVLAALTVAGEHNGKADSVIVVCGAIFWPCALIALAVIGVIKLGAPLGRRCCRIWEAGVCRLNPKYEGMS